MNLKPNKIPAKLTLIVLTLFIYASAFAQQRVMEKLDRAVVAVKSKDGVFVSWRKFAYDTNNVTYNVYRNSSLVNSTPISDISNYLDKEGTNDSYYYIEILENGQLVNTTDAVAVWNEGYKEIPLQTPDDYEPDDCSIADLDGDGEYEIVVKFYGSHQDNSVSGITDPVLLRAYKFNGTLLWNINLGINIRAGAHYTQFMVYDLDGDGKAEMACKTAPGTTDATGSYLSQGPAANDDDSQDYRNSGGYILDGPEYLTVFNGETGKEITTVDYVPDRYPTNGWGDEDENYNRVDRFLACVAYFDSIPSLVMCRGYYGRSVLAAWDFKDNSLTQRWVFDTDSIGYGKDGNADSLYAGQGAHSLSVGDVDGDGKDEIIYGAMAVDDDGVGLWTTGNCHGDAIHLGDFLPDSAGLEYFMVCENDYGENKVTGGTVPSCWFAHASTGQVIWELESTSHVDVGRGYVDDITTDISGPEFLVGIGDGLVLDQNGNEIDHSSDMPAQNFGAWWDGDITREVLSDNAIKKWSTTEKYSLLEPSDCESNYGTKAVPALSGDIMGDWREEVIWKTSDNQKLRIYTTTDTTEYGLYSLIQDPQYRLALCWQNVGYNQPPHPSFYIGEGMEGFSDQPTPNTVMVTPKISSYIQITNPVEGDTIHLGTTLTTTLHLSEVSSTIYLNFSDSTVDTIYTIPYVSQLKMKKSGTFDLFAWGYDLEGNKIVSDTLNIYVDQGYPIIALTSPESDTLVSISDNFLVSAEAYDYDGTVESVSFYVNNTEVATVTAEPFSSTIENPGYGVHDLMAIATDNDGKKDTSAIRSITIGDSLVIQEKETGYCGFLTTGYYESNHEGYTGEGFANTANAKGAGIKWAINIPTEGNYKFYWRYATNGDRPGLLTLNDTIGGDTIALASTDDSWDEWTMQESQVYTLSVGYYAVALTATTSDGLANIDYINVISLNTNGAEILSCDSINNETTIDIVSLDENISLYPNPTLGILNIKVSSDIGEIGRVSIYDYSGKQVISDEYFNQQVQLDVSYLNKGVYLVKLNNSAGVCTKKLIIN